MKRRVLLSGLFASLVLAGPTVAQDVATAIVSQLRSQGFTTIDQEKTLLGRVRIYAVRGDGTREIILNPRTGEILRDLWLPIAGGAAVGGIFEDPVATSGGKPKGDDAEEEEEEEEEGEHDDDDDDSGSGDDDDDDDDDDDSDDHDDDDDDDDDG